MPRADAFLFATIMFTEKCLPMSRRKSRYPTPAVQLTLSINRAGLVFASKSSNRRSCSFTLAMFALSTSRVSNWRSCVLPLGSPMEPVAPPATAMG